MSRREHAALTYAAHFGFGAAMGGVYGLLEHTLRLPAPIAGVGYALAVWMGELSRLAAGRQHPARGTRDRPERTFLMVFAHIVWGTFLDPSLGLFRCQRPLVCQVAVPR